eukprot:9492655-Pyramimonas_sp.AAC.1
MPSKAPNMALPGRGRGRRKPRPPGIETLAWRRLCEGIAYSENPCQETPCLPPGCPTAPWVLGLR